MIRALALAESSIDEDLRENKNSFSEYCLIDMPEFKWNAPLIDNSEIKLISTTQNTVSRGEIPSFISAFYHIRLRESEEALRAMRRGKSELLNLAYIRTLQG